MQLSAHPGSHALEAAFARVSRLPLPIAGVPLMPLECGYTDIPPYDDSTGEYDEVRMASGGDEYTDNYHDAYSDDPYVDAPYDDYQDNAPEED